jgi:NADH:ubiquinone oxidoreductase subunit 4 (subunit M)
VAAFAPLVLLVLLMGIYPNLFLDPIAASVDQLIAQASSGAGGELAAR